jgi:hypothetical protein
VRSDSWLEIRTDNDCWRSGYLCASGRFLDNTMRSRPSLFRHRSSWGVLEDVTPVMFKCKASAEQTGSGE